MTENKSYSKPCPKCGNDQLTMVWNSGKISSLGKASMDYKCGGCNASCRLSVQFGDNHYLCEMSLEEIKDD